jgi:HSP90 family molecular chaperone
VRTSIQTAIADIVDNSISAGAKNIWIDFNWNGTDSTVSIRDDGCGMTESVLKTAMRLGSMSPSSIRDPKDMGRFGLGLKTASFSQCRKFTVISKYHDDAICIRCWDIDCIIKTNNWHERAKWLNRTPMLP